MMDKALIAIADTHGHLDLLQKLLQKIDEEYEQYDLVFMGDYCDNGPQIPELLDFLIEYTKQENVHAILGNHDLACIRALGYPTQTPDPVWFSRWAGRYWDPGLGTPEAYGAYTPQDFKNKMPESHQDFLRSLPWILTFRDHVFVHSGMNKGSLIPQIQDLEHRILPQEHEHLPPQIRDKSLSNVNDPDWEMTVVSAHNKKPNGEYGKNFLDSKRVCIAADVDTTKCLRAVELLSRREMVS